MIQYAKTILLSLFLLGAVSTCDASAEFSPSDERIAYVGRVSLTNPDKAVFTWPGVQLHYNFSGTSAKLRMKPDSGYFMVEVDDNEPKKVKSTDAILTLAEGLPEGNHRITVTSCNEGLRKHPEIYGLIFDDGHGLLEKPELPVRKMEFIGNSITCGLGNEGDPKAKKFDNSMQNSYYTYEAIASRELNSQWVVVARSGIGIYRKNNGNIKGDEANMPNMYENVQFGLGGEKWDFSKYTPDVVCVNLGTNDTSNPGYDMKLLTEAYVKFLKKIRGHYPEAKIVLLTGTMINGKRLEDVKKAHRDAIAEAKSRGDNEVYTFDFTPEDGTMYGVFKHPSRKRHEKMAEELVPFIKEITGWE
ncbi:MAG: lipase [Muribaculaceae bacterium]|nr:lipase [Muribaculaceae bacterium]